MIGLFCPSLIAFFYYKIVFVTKLMIGKILAFLNFILRLRNYHIVPRVDDLVLDTTPIGANNQVNNQVNQVEDLNNVVLATGGSDAQT